MRVAIVGAGMGGLALARALHLLGIEVSVHEQAGRLHEVGAGVQISPNASRVLEGLGLLQAALEVATLAEATRIRHGVSGDLLSRRVLGATARERYGAPYLQILRSDLQRILVQSLPSQCLHLGQRVVEVDALAGSFTVQNGDRVQADLIVGADGIHSVVRQQTVGDTPAQFTGEVAYRALVPSSFWSEPEIAGAVWVGEGRHVVQYLVDSGRRLNLVAVVPRDDWQEETWSSPASQAELEAEFIGWHPDLTRVLGAVDQAFKWALFDRPPLRAWSQGRATLLGDAAHPMSPSLSQGAAQALEDAWVLAQAVNAHPHQVDRALLDYERARVDRTTRIQAQSRRNQALARLSLKVPTPPAADGSSYRQDVLGDEFLDWLYGWDVTSGRALQPPPHLGAIA